MRRKYALSEAEKSHVQFYTGGRMGDRRPAQNLGGFLHNHFWRLPSSQRCPTLQPIAERPLR